MKAQVRSPVDLLRQHGLRVTPARTCIVQTLQRAPRTPPELVRLLQRSSPGTNTVTIYRALEQLSQAGLIHRHSDSGRYAACSLPDKNGHHGLMHCTSCDGLQEFSDPALCRLEHAIAAKANFSLHHHTSEFSGICRDCHTHSHS